MTTPNGQYQPLGPGRFVSFAQKPGGPPAAPYDWPQKTLYTPPPLGGVPAVNQQNVTQIGRDFYALAMPPVTNLAAGAEVTQIIKVPQDGDFWCENIAAGIIFGANNYLSYIPVLLQVTDVASGYKFMPSGPTWDGANISFFNTLQGYSLSAFASFTAVQFGAGQRTSWMEPYCFLRSSAIEIKLSYPPGTSALHIPGTIHVNLSGWREYENAAA